MPPPVEPDGSQAMSVTMAPASRSLLAVPHASGLQRFRPGSPSDGTGLGLTVAVGQAGLIGARLSLRNRPQGGAETVPCRLVSPAAAVRWMSRRGCSRCFPRT